MRLMLKKILVTNLNLKIISLIFGYALWATISKHQITELNIAVPLCFYNTQAPWKITAPETIAVRISAQREFFALLHRESIAIHINGQELSAGTQPLHVSNAQLFLPEAFKLVHYSPSPLLITVDHHPDVSA